MNLRQIGWMGLVIALALFCQLPAAEDSGVYFGKAQSTPEYISGYRDFSAQGRFFSTADYGSTPGASYGLTGKAFGITYWLGRDDLYVRGKDGTRPLPRFRGANGGWLSDGGACSFGLNFDKPFVPTWMKPGEAQAQFAGFPNRTPTFDQVVIHWGALVPKKGSWTFSLQDAGGASRTIALDERKALYPFDWTTIDFPPTTLKGIKVDIQAGAGKDNFAQVLAMAVNLHTAKTIDNRVSVWQHDAYHAAFATDRPGTLSGIEVFNLYPHFKAPSDFAATKCALTDLAPFIEGASGRIQANPGSPAVQVERSGRTFTLRYELQFAVPGQQPATVKAAAIFGVDMKDAVRFEFKASGLPAKARLGFAMAGLSALFAKHAGTVATGGAGKTLATLAGPYAIRTTGTAAVDLTAPGGDKPVRFECFADGSDLGIALSLPIGPLSGVQPGSQNWEWYPSPARQGEEGLAPFTAADLELLEDIDLSDPASAYEIFDITNDPLLKDLRGKAGELPKQFGRLYHIKEPEKGRVPLSDVLGAKCRVINDLDSTYFRFNLKKARFEPQTPYLIVVEHAFDRERRGEFHAVAVDPANSRIVEANLWDAPNPFGGFDTGKAPHDGRFRKESVFVFHPWGSAYSRSTVVSLCFSNTFGYNHIMKTLPQGLAVKSVAIYRIKRMPRLPDLAPLLPQGPRRQLTLGTENASPFQLSEFPKLVGNDTIWANNQQPGQFLHGKASYGTRPGAGLRWYPGSLKGQEWLYERAAQLGLRVKIHESALLDLGFEGTDSFSYAERSVNTALSVAPPLSATSEELAHLATALDRSLAALAKYPSFGDITVLADLRGFFSKRNLDDFTKETGTVFAASPAPLENIRNLLDADRKTVEAWMTWSCRKRHDYLDWLLKLARKHKPDIYLTINESSDTDTFREAYESEKLVPSWLVMIPKAKLTAQGINGYVDFLRLLCHDPALYAGQDGFCFGLGKERGVAVDDRTWASPYALPDFPRIRDGFGGGLTISSSQYDESPKPLKNWTCHYVRDERSFRRDLIEGLLHANARGFFLDTYYFDPCRGRLNELRAFAVPFLLLPFAKPEDYAGKLSDPAKQAVIRKFGDRFALMNAGDKATEVVLALPPGATTATDLSNGMRQPLTAGKNGITISMEPWSLRTLEIR